MSDKPKKAAPAKKAAPKKKAISLWEKVWNVQLALGVIQKTGNNDHHKYTYAKEGDMLTALKPLFQEHRLLVMPTGVTNQETEGNFARIEMEFLIKDLDSDEEHKSRFWGESKDSDDKKFYKAYTGCVKYFLAKTFQLETGDDPEDPKNDKQFENQRAQEALSEAEQAFATAQNMISVTKSIDGLLDYQGKLATSKRFNAKQKTTLTNLINARINELQEAATA